MEEYRFNDGKISPGGVFIGGRMHKTGAQVDGKHGRWYRLEWHQEEGKSRLVQVFSTKLTCATHAPSSVTVALWLLMNSAHSNGTERCKLERVPFLW